MAFRVFTGLVQTQGQLQGRNARGVGFVLSIRHDFGALELGESIAVNGACLTVISSTKERFEADCSKETVERSNLGRITIGSSVHLERALRVGDRLGGHFVSGHVDALVQLLSSERQGEAQELTFDLPQTLLAYIAEKGSVTLDGVSLTVNTVTSDQFAVMVVPHSLRATHLGSLRRGDGVNLEVDVLARHIVHAVRLGMLPYPTTDLNGQEPSVNRDDALRKAMSRAGML
jgi:riboflavin synthase